MTHLYENLKLMNTHFWLFFFSFDKSPPKAAKGEKNKLLKRHKEHPQDHKSSVKFGRAEEQNHASKMHLWAKSGSDLLKRCQPTRPSSSSAHTDLCALKTRNWGWPALLKIIRQMPQIKVIGIRDCFWTPALIFWPSLCWCSNLFPPECLKHKMENILVRIKGRKSL